MSSKRNAIYDGLNIDSKNITDDMALEVSTAKKSKKLGGSWGRLRSNSRKGIAELFGLSEPVSEQSNSNNLKPPAAAPISGPSRYPIFGISLNELMDAQRFQYPNLCIPWFVHQAIELLKKDGLKEQGIFRISGNMDEIKALRTSLELGTPLPSTTDVHVVACLLKQFVKEIPGGLFGNAARDILQYAKNCDRKTINLEELKSMLDHLPLHTKTLVRALFSFFKLVADNSKKNSMPATNLATTNCPNLFPTIGLDDIPFVNTVVVLLIDKWPFFLGEQPLEIKILRFVVNDK